MSKRPKLAYHQATAANNNNRGETSASDVVEYEYTGRGKYAGTGDRVPDNVTHARIHPSVIGIRENAFHSREHLKEVVLNDGLTVIGSNAFMNCSSLQKISIPSTVIKIDEDSFRSCTGLKEVVLSEGLTSIGSAFIDCKALQSIKIPSTVTEIGVCAFIRCNSLREVVLSNGLKKIAGHSFQCCTSLQSITIPSTVDEIGTPNAFYSCNSLRRVTLNEGLKKIGRAAFRDCTSIERITIPSTVDEIGSNVFGGCIGLREIVMHNKEVQIDDAALIGCTSLDGFKFPSLSTRLNNIIQAGQRSIEAKIDDIPAVEWRAGELLIPPVRREIVELWGTDTVVKLDKEKMDKIVRLIRHYEVKEATTLFELALWKVKIDQADISNPPDRGAYRVDVPGPVKDTILQYLR